MPRTHVVFLLCLLISGCFFDDASDDSDEDTSTLLNCDLTAAEVAFEDSNPTPNAVSGTIQITSPNLSCNAQAFTAQWETATQREVGQGFLISQFVFESQRLLLTLPDATPVPDSATRLRIIPRRGDQAGANLSVTIVDYQAMVDVVGPGGNRFSPWYYGEDRPALTMRLETRGLADYCVFDNGRVLIHDSAYERYDDVGKNTADDLLYSPFEFDCTESKENLHRAVYEYDDNGEEVVQTYSVINDAYYYGNISFDMFEKYWQTRPLDKLRIRMHYGPEYSINLVANWDGAYVNLNDAQYQAYGLATLDIIAHEAAHGVLQQQTALKHVSDVEDYSYDGRTLHEAYADLAAVMAHYELYGELNWEIGEENHAYIRRYMDRIVTESGAITSYLDYSDAGVNYYKRMGMVTYPFYELTQKWGIEQVFVLYTQAAKMCWQPNGTLQQAAECIKTQAEQMRLNTSDVIEAFRTVKIKLADEDTFAHFKFDSKKLRTQFTDNSQSDRTLVSYEWQFGDGTSSTEVSPYYEYAASGEYEVNLTVLDNTGFKDEFSRTLIINDQYCAIRTTSSDWQFNSVQINGVSLAFDANESDYTDTIIQVDAGQPIPIKIEGDILNPEKTSTTWYVWVDLNDDAEFSGRDYNDETSSEQRLRVSQKDSEFGLDTTFEIPEKYRGKTFFMRVSSDSIGSPCYCDTGSTFDVRIRVND